MANLQATPISPLLAQDPNFVLQQMQAQRQARIADMLTQQSFEPVQYDQRGPVSWTQGLAKMLEAYAGNKMAQDSNAKLADAQSQSVQRLAQALSPQPVEGPSTAEQAMTLGAQNGSVGPTQGNAAIQAALPPQPALRPAPLNPAGWNSQYAAQQLLSNPEAYWKAQNDAMAPTTEQKNSRDALIGASVRSNLQTQNLTELQKLQQARSQVPDGSVAAQQLDAAIQKANYVAPAEVKQGNVALDRDNRPIFYNPKTADGIAPMFTTQDGVTMPTGARALPGYAGANAGIAGAEQGAKQAATIMTVPGQDNVPITSWGGNFASAPGGFRGPNANQQTDMGKRWGDLYGQASQAQNVISYLQQIKQLAPMADTGQFSDRTQIANSLLSMVGSEKANDAVSAKNLLDKYSNQIVARLGQGGLGTDAAREIVSAAYPNSHMTAKAIAEAADNAIGAQVALQSKAKLLGQHYNAGNPRAYQQTESMFDAAADPRIFQWRAMPEGTAKNAFIRDLLKADPTMKAKIGALDALGVN